MTDEDVKYFSEFLREFQGETDRGAALVGAALIDDRLERLLLSNLTETKESSDLVSGSNAPLGTFSSRIKAAYCFGLISQLEFNECNLIRRIRNEFAHQLPGISFESNKIKDLCNNLRADLPPVDPSAKTARYLFVNSVSLVSLALWYRPDYNRARKREKSNWDYQLAERKVRC